MKIIFEKTPSTELHVYIHCSSAGDQLKLSESTFIHSEYESKWSQLLYEWSKKEYYKFYNIEQMPSRNSVITLLIFTHSNDDQFIKELSNHLDVDHSSGYYIIDYKLFDNEY